MTTAEPEPAVIERCIARTRTGRACRMLTPVPADLFDPADTPLCVVHAARQAKGHELELDLALLAERQAARLARQRAELEAWLRYHGATPEEARQIAEIELERRGLLTDRPPAPVIPLRPRGEARP